VEQHTQREVLNKLTYTIKNIWNAWYEIWKYRCDTNQGDNPINKELRTRQRLLPQVQQLYNEIDQIDPSDSYIFKSTQEELLSQKPHKIERWVHIARLRVKDSVARAKQRIKQSHLPIHQYFVHVTTLLQTRKTKTKSHRLKKTNTKEKTSSKNSNHSSKCIQQYFHTTQTTRPAHQAVLTNNDLFPP
jgi:hypothetical protein